MCAPGAAPVKKRRPEYVGSSSVCDRILGTHPSGNRQRAANRSEELGDIARSETRTVDAEDDELGIRGVDRGCDVIDEALIHRPLHLDNHNGARALGVAIVAKGRC